MDLDLTLQVRFAIHSLRFTIVSLRFTIVSLHCLTRLVPLFDPTIFTIGVPWGDGVAASAGAGTGRAGALDVDQSAFGQSGTTQRYSLLTRLSSRLNLLFSLVTLQMH